MDNALATLQHEKGWFVMIRLNNLPGAECEIAAGLRALTPHMPALLQQHTKAGQLHRGAWRVVMLFLFAHGAHQYGVGCKSLYWL